MNLLHNNLIIVITDRAQRRPSPPPTPPAPHKHIALALRLVHDLRRRPPAPLPPPNLDPLPDPHGSPRRRSRPRPAAPPHGAERHDRLAAQVRRHGLAVGRRRRDVQACVDDPDYQDVAGDGGEDDARDDSRVRRRVERAVGCRDRAAGARLAVVEEGWSRCGRW